MKSLSVFRSRVESQAEGCPEFLTDQVVLDACIDFCERTLLVRTTDQFTTVSGTKTYSLPTGQSQVAYKAIRVWCGSKELAPISVDDIDTPFAFADAITGETAPSGTPVGFVDVGNGEIALLPVPDGTYTVTAVVAQKPSRSATTVEDSLFEDWVEAVTSGALARLYSMPNDAKFFNPQLSAAHSANFALLTNRARMEAQSGAARLNQRVAPVWI